jgi:hypothetical protein
MEEIKNVTNLRISKLAITSFIMGFSSFAVYVCIYILLSSAVINGCPSMVVHGLTSIFCGITGFMGFIIGIVALVLIQKKDFLKGQTIVIVGMLFSSISFGIGLYYFLVD